MAINKVYVYASMNTEIAENITAFMSANASEYFDSITNVGYGKIRLNVDGTQFVEISCTNGSSVTVKGQTYSSTSWWRYAYACDGGVSLANDSGIVFTITKDSSDETVVVFADALNSAPENAETVTVYATTIDSPETSATVVPYHAVSDGITVLTPLVIRDAVPSFTPSVDVLTYSQHVSGTGEAVLDIDGTDYLSNGLWAVKA